MTCVKLFAKTAEVSCKYKIVFRQQTVNIWISSIYRWARYPSINRERGREREKERERKEEREKEPLQGKSQIIAPNVRF